MAVDRSKFRTCDQTSFCRRHRSGRSQSIYQYRVLPDTIQILQNDDTPLKQHDAQSKSRNPNGGEEKEGKQTFQEFNLEKKGMLGYLMNRMLSSNNNHESSSSSSSSNHDPYLRGPPSAFTATLLNTSPTTSTGDTEMLTLNIHLHQDGVARIRITEVYNSDTISDDTVHSNKPYHSNPRWTSDDLILNLDEMVPDNDVEILLPSDQTTSDLMKQVVHAMTSLSGGISITSEHDYIVFYYGNKEQASTSSILVLQLNPFAIYLWRKDGLESNALPLVTINSNNMLHFEIRRNKHSQNDTNSDILNHDERNEENQELEGMDDEDDTHLEEGDRHGGKEIVGYWEDGLAIYADGTREQPKEESERHISSNDSQETITTEQQRILTEQQQSHTMDTEGMWEESFGSHKDSKPHGPMSVGADIYFPSSKHLFGLPEHASSTQLKSTIGSNAHYQDPYRLYNLDVFEYELDETMALYGEVPFIVSQSAIGGTVGVFWFNPTETFVDVRDDDTTDMNDSKGTQTHWMSESGVIDLFLLPGPNPSTLYEQYAHLTGRMPLPPIFSLGYHQCRWNYRDENDVYNVHDKFEELDYPYDVLWLDIEHTDGKRYFTWDDALFPHPEAMQEKLHSQGRRMVTIVDPHIKRDTQYYIHKEATNLGLYVKDASGRKDFDGWCWPGSSSYLDFTNSKVRSWWAEQFQYNRYRKSTPSLYTWNDMNEPSVFNGPEVSMQKDLLNLDGVEHREWHNLYGLLFHAATSEGLTLRNKNQNERPFVLSRSFFAGSQKYGAIWTGDNESSWSHLAIASPMLLSLNIAALSFVGADVGGFFGNPDAELMVRWMQAGAYQPFFRGHAHHDSKRREPWMFGEEWMIRMRKSAMARYALLSYWYTTFYYAGITGMPVMRSLWMEYPLIEDVYSIDDQYLIGSDLLVKPITAPGITEIEVIFPLKDNWYDVDSLIEVSAEDRNRYDQIQVLKVHSGIDKIPVYQRGGSIIARKLRLRRSTKTMTIDPYTLYIALDSFGNASGPLYMDDEHSFDHENEHKFALASFSVEQNFSVIRNSVSLGSGWENEILKKNHMIERIVIMGIRDNPKTLKINSIEVEFNYNESLSVIIVRKPSLSACENWEILVEK